MVALVLPHFVGVYPAGNELPVARVSILDTNPVVLLSGGDNVRTVELADSEANYDLVTCLHVASPS